LTLEGLKIVVDCANGAAYKVRGGVQRAGADVIAMGIRPDGTNINDVWRAPSAELQQAVVKSGAHLGIAVDGDADRVIICDELGEEVDGDTIMAMCAQRMIERGELNHNTLVATVMSNLGLERSIERMGGKLSRVQVGDRYVVEEMRSNGYNFGGEQSGHLVFLDHMTTGDGGPPAPCRCWRSCSRAASRCRKLRRRDDALSAGAGELQGEGQACR